MMELANTSGLGRVLLFLKILECLCLAPIKDKKAMVSASYAPAMKGAHLERIESIRKWVNESLCDHISLKKAADHVKMTPKYFSIFFKKNTGKNFSEYVKEIRLGLVQYLLNSE